MIREQRSTRGQRMNELVGKAMEEDDLFYNNDIWKDDDDDSGNESYGEEFEEENDIFDDDFNDTEDESDSEDDEDEKNTRKKENNQKRKTSQVDNRYKEPGMVAIKKKRDPNEPKPRKIQRIGDHMEQNEVFSIRTRVSTQAKTTDSDIARKVAIEFASSKKSPNKDKLPRQIFSQKQLLSEALMTEGDNLRWIEVQKKAAQTKDILNNKSSKQKLTNFIRFHSRKGTYDTVTFSDLDTMPSILKQNKC